jgi:hypothetical protein
MGMLEGREETSYSRFCERLLALDASLTYVGLADRFGSLITGAYRSVPFPDEKEAEQYSVQTTLSALIMEHFESRAGKIRYSITEHEKTVRVTVPAAVGGEKFFILMIMMMKADAEQDGAAAVVRDKVLPFVSYSDLCERLLALDASLTYVGLADRFGSLVTAAFREGSHAGEKEVRQYSMQSAISALVAEHFETGTGKARYQVTFYDETARAAVPLALGNGLFVLMMTGLNPGLVSIVTDKVLPYLSDPKNVL